MPRHKESSSESQKRQYQKYATKYEANRKRRLERHLKKYPNDATAKKALKDINYRRKKPISDTGNKMFEYFLKYNMEKVEPTESLTVAEQLDSLNIGTKRGRRRKR